MTSESPGRAAPAAAPATIRRILRTEVDAFRSLRLRALREDPLAFGSTLERELAFEPAKWQERVTSSAESNQECVFVAEVPDRGLVGMAGSFTHGRHVIVYGMWVAPERRGGGVGGALLDAVLAWVAKTTPGVEVYLSVNPTQLAAVQLYLNRGFRPTGSVEPLGHTAGAVVHEMRRSAAP
jgi:GNAT superfamily N-acetyltransferase